METTSASTVSVQGFSVLNETSNNTEPELKLDKISGNNKKMSEVSSDEQTDDRMRKAGSGSPRPSKVKPSAGDRIASVTDNPFYKLAGGRPFKSSRTDMPAFLKRSRNCFDTDDLGEYKPASGHVHKLSGKFASLESASFAKLKHASSADDILDERNDDQSQQIDGNRSWVNSLNHRAGSVESLSPRKTSSVFPVSLRHVERKWAPVSFPPKSPRESRTEAPDINLARDDIVLIEKPPEPSPPPVNKDEEEKKLESEVHSQKDELGSSALPKLNTVSAVRGLFEVGVSPRSSSPAAQILEANNNDETPLPGSSASEDAGLYPSTVDTDSHVYRATRINLSPAEFLNEITPGQGGVKPDDADGSDSSRSSTPPPLPLSPPPLPLSPPPSLPQSLPPGSSTILDSDVSDVPADASDVKPEVCVSSKSENESIPSAPVISPKPSLQSLSPEQTVLPPSKPVPLSKPVPPTKPVPPPLPRSVGTVKATPVYHPIPFRGGAGVFRPGAIVPPSFTPSIKKSSPVASVAPFRENRAEKEGADSRFPFPSKISSSSTHKTERHSKDYCEVVVEKGVNTIRKENEEMKEQEEIIKEKERDRVKEPDIKQTETDEVNKLSREIKQKERENVHEQNTNITQEETNEMKDAGSNSQKETGKIKEPDAEMSEEDSDEMKDIEIISNTDTITVTQSEPTTQTSEVDSNWIPSLHSADPDATENLWKLALKPVSKRAEDSQPTPIAVRPVPITSSAPASGSQDPSQSELDVQSDEKAETTQPASSSELTDVTKTEEDTSTESINLPEKRKEEEEIQVKSEDSDSLAGTGKVEQLESKPEESSSVVTNSTSPTTSSESVEPSEPVRGIPTIIANRLKQNTQKQNGDSEPSRSPGELFGVRLSKIQRRKDPDTEDQDGIPHKRLAHGERSPPESSSTPEIVNQFAGVLKKKDHSSRNKPSQIFDSSQLQKKRKERKAAKAAAAAGVSEVDGKGGQKQVPPCNVEFIGANISTGRSLLGKSRKVKINVQFHETLAQTFEYPSEEDMLQQYLKSHPGEVLVLDQLSWPLESSSDEVDIRGLLRRGGLEAGEGALLKSNTSLAHSGSLQSYRSKYQQDYELGSILNFPEKSPEPQTSDDTPTADPDAMELLPAAEEELQTYSLDTSSDLLF